MKSAFIQQLFLTQPKLLKQYDILNPLELMEELRQKELQLSSSKMSLLGVKLTQPSPSGLGLGSYSPHPIGESE